MKTQEFVEAVGSVAGEFQGVQLGDRRLPKRLRKIAEIVSAAPAKGFPQATQSSGDLEGIYRFLNNRRVKYLALVEAHAKQTCERVVRAGTVLVIHDTTEIAFGGEATREGLGFVNGKGQGFLAHCAIAVAADGSRRPLGTLGLACWARTELGKSRTSSGKRRSGADYAKVPHKESARWSEMVGKVRDCVGTRASLIHVMDREGDAYPLLAGMIEQNDRFVIRVARDRVVVTEEGDRLRLSQAAELAPILLEADVPISSRGASKIPRRNRTSPRREHRVAKLSVSAQTLELQRPRYLPDVPETLHVNVVRIWEQNPPDQTEPICWTLVTTEPVNTRQEIAAIVEHYRARWTIEEFFKALKTGCALELRQLESYDALVNTLALFLPVAWQMLFLRHISRSQPDIPAHDVLSEVQIRVLRKFHLNLPDRLTAKDALYAIAALGGHLKHNGPPGWQTLARGMLELVTLERGWVAALDITPRDQIKRSDQS